MLSSNMFDTTCNSTLEKLISRALPSTLGATDTDARQLSLAARGYSLGPSLSTISPS